MMAVNIELSLGLLKRSNGRILFSQFILFIIFIHMGVIILYQNGSSTRLDLANKQPFPSSIFTLYTKSMIFFPPEFRQFVVGFRCRRHVGIMLDSWRWNSDSILTLKNSYYVLRDVLLLILGLLFLKVKRGRIFFANNSIK